MAMIVLQRWTSTAPRRFPATNWRPAAVERNKRREYSRVFLDYGPNQGPFSVFADGRRRREPSLTGDKAPRRLVA
jgi:hypothetical protein